jgi:hypothetical protein
VGDQARRPIREELLSIPGIAGAEFEGDASTPDGVKVQLAPGADPERVGAAVRRVLAGHGMRSQMTAPAVAPKQPPPPPDPRTVVNLADFDPSLGRDFDASVATTEESPVEGATEKAGDVDDAALETDPARAQGTTPAEDPPLAAPVGALAAVPILGDVVVRQRGAGIAVSVATADRVADRLAVASESGIDQALLEAVCELLGVDPVPALVAVTVADQEGSSVVSVLLHDGSAHQAGSAVSRGNRAWAVARAIWSAVSGPA